MGESPKKLEYISTGSINLDKVLGVGGLPKGRIIEIYGPEGSGKSTLALHMIAEAQKYGRVAFIDAEHALDIEYAKKLNINVDQLFVSQPTCGEEALEIVDILVRTGEASLIVIDSVAALTPRAEIEGDMGSSHMGLQARLMSQAMRKITGVISKTNTIVVFINQIRSKIGVMYGSPETTTGGNALKFYASVRIDVRRVESIKNGEEIIGNKIKCKVVKNRVAPPFKECQTYLIFGKGIDRGQELLDLAIDKKIIVKDGAWYCYKEEKLQGREKMAEYIRNNEKKIIKEIL